MVLAEPAPETAAVSPMALSADAEKRRTEHIASDEESARELSGDNVTEMEQQHSMAGEKREKESQ